MDKFEPDRANCKFVGLLTKKPNIYRHAMNGKERLQARFDSRNGKAYLSLRGVDINPQQHNKHQLLTCFTTNVKYLLVLQQTSITYLFQC